MSRRKFLVFSRNLVVSLQGLLLLGTGIRLTSDSKRKEKFVVVDGWVLKETDLTNNS